MDRNEYDELVKPWKLCEGVDRSEIAQIRQQMWSSRIDIREACERQIAAIEAAPQERMFREYATRERAAAEAAHYNQGAPRGFRYYVIHIDATLADLATDY